MSADYAATLLRSVGSTNRWKEVAMRNSAGAPTPSDMSEIPARSFMLGFAGLLFVTVVGFVSALKTSIPTLADYGYDEALGTQTSSLSSASFLSNCFNGGPRIAGASKDGLGKLEASAIVAHGAGSSTANFHPSATGECHVE